jgi:diguanylate cyclase (GGDEF)-like protein
MDAADLWFNVFLMPIDYEDGDVCYCTYTTKITEVKELDLLSTESLQTSSDVIRTCIKLHGTDDFEQTMKDIIKDIRIICGAEVCSLMLIDFSTGSYSMLATSVRENSRIKRVTQFTNFYDIAASWIDTIGESECLIIKSKQDMKYIEKINNPWFLTLDEAGVDSVVMFPLRYNREVLGYIWATNFATENAMRIKETLELTTFFVSSEVATYKMMKRLEHISYTDLLTGVKNRNAMNNRITAITNGEELLTEPYGVVFVDLNGLKQVNDEQGHQAGDLLLKKAALILQEIFVDEDIYRAGGDEFLIITAGCDQQQFDKKIELLRKKASDPDNVSFSIGVCYGDHGCDVRDAMGVADGKMYDDKQHFYVLHPERKHR